MATTAESFLGEPTSPQSAESFLKEEPSAESFLADESAPPAAAESQGPAPGDVTGPEVSGSLSATTAPVQGPPVPPIQGPALPRYSDEADRQRQAEEAEVYRRFAGLEPKTPEYLAAKDKYSRYDLNGKFTLSPELAQRIGVLPQKDITDPEELKKLRKFKGVQHNLLLKAGDPGAKAMQTLNDTVWRAASQGAEEQMRMYPFGGAFQDGGGGGVMAPWTLPKENQLGVIGRTITKSAGATAGGLGTMALASALAPETFGLSFLLPLIGGVVGAIGGQKGQEAALQTIDNPEDTARRYQEYSDDEKNHYWTVKATELAEAGLAFRPSPTTLKNAARAAGFIKLGAPVPAVEAQALKQVAGMFGIGAGAHVAFSPLTGNGFTAADLLNPEKMAEVGEAGLMMSIFSKPTWLGRALGFPLHEAIAHTSDGLEAAGMPAAAAAMRQNAQVLAGTPGPVPEGPASPKPPAGPESGPNPPSPASDAPGGAQPPGDRAYFDSQGNLVLTAQPGEGAIPTHPPTTPPTPAPAGQPSLRDRLLAAIESAPTRGSLGDKSPSTLNFDIAPGVTTSVQNTRESLLELARRKGVDLPQYLPAFQRADGEIFIGRPDDNGEFPHGHNEPQSRAEQADIDGGREVQKGKRGYVDEKGQFIDMMEVARRRMASPEPPPPPPEAPPESFDYVQPQRIIDRPPGQQEEVVEVSIDAFDKAWEKAGGGYHIPRGETTGRMQRFHEWLNGETPLESEKDLPPRSQRIETPEVYIDAEGNASFTNGRNRFSYMRERGQKTIKVSMDPESAARARALGIAADAPPDTQTEAVAQKVEADLKAESDTPESPTGAPSSAPEDHVQLVKDALASAHQETGFPDQLISEVQKRTGLSLEDLHAAIRKGSREGVFVPTRGDLSFASQEAKDAALIIHSELDKSFYRPEHLQVRNLDLDYRPNSKAAPVESEPPSEPPGPPHPPELPPDAPTPPGARGATSIKNEYTDQRRAQLGLAPAFAPLRRAFGSVWEDAMAILDANPKAAIELSKSLENNARPVTDTEDALLLHHLTTLENQHDDLVDRLNVAYDKGGSDLDDLRGLERDAREELERAYDVDKKVGTEQGRGLNARKMRANRDFTLARMLANARAAKGGLELQPHEEQLEIDAHREIQRLQAELDTLRAKQEEDASSKAADEQIAKLVAQVEAENQAALARGDETAAPEETPAEGDGEAQSAMGGVPAVRVKASAIASRPDLMQFKRMDDAETGINKEDKLTGEFDDKKAGLILLWEPANPEAYGLEPGQKYIVANGHHRVEFGNRQGVDSYNAQIVREADGVSAEDARRLGAEINIADGKGTIYDQAKFLRNYAATHGADEAMEAGRRIGARGRKAAQVAFSATDRLFDAFVNGKIDPDAAAGIAAAAPGNEAAQSAGMRASMAGKDADFAANRAKAELTRDTSAARTGPVEYDLFGNEVFAEIDAQAERATAEQKRLSEEIRAVRGAANKPELARKHGVDVADPEGVKKRIAELEAERARWENWPNHPDLVEITKQPMSGETPTPPESAKPEAATPPAEKPAAAKKGRIKQALEALGNAAEAAKARLKERAEARARGQTLFSGGLDPRDLDDYAIIGADYVAKGAKTLGRFTARLVMEFGEFIREHAKAIFDRARQIHADTVSPRDLGAERESVVQGIKTRAQEGDTLEDLRSYVRKLSLNYVRRGITDREALIDAVHADLKEVDPNLTRRQTMDLISGYGDFKALDREEAKKQLRELKGQMQQIGKLEDMSAGEAPKKTGVERREISDAERQLIKQVNEAKKRGGFEITDPSTQLKSAVEGVRTRLRNQIADIEHLLATRERPKTKTKVQHEDPEIIRLTAERDRLKQLLDDMHPKAGKTDEQRVKTAMEATQRSIAEYERRLKEKDFGKSGGEQPTSPELEAMRAHLEAVRQQYNELRDLDATVAAEKEATKTKGIQDQIDALDKKLQAGDLSTKGRENPLLTPGQQALVAERDAMLKLLNKLRREAIAKPAAEKQVEALLKQIGDLETRLANGDLDPKARGAVQPLSPEAADAMMHRDALRRALQEERQNAKPKKSKEEIALQAWKTRAMRKQAELLDAMAQMDSGTYTEPPPKQPVKLDAAGEKLAFDLDQTKKAHNTRLVEYRMRQRSPLMKIFGVGIESLNLARAIMTSYDLSGVLRQGGMVSLAHPIRTARALPDMIRAAWSEQGRHRLENEILTRPNAPNYRRDKLALTEESSSLGRLEEAYMSRWLHKLKITRDLGGLQHALNLPLGLVRASERAYSYILNRIRADAYDALAKSLGVTPDGVNRSEGKAIANYINIATGRPSLGVNGDKAATALNVAFFAPKYVASRFMAIADMASLGSVSGGNLKTRALIASEYGRYLASVGIIAGLYHFMTGRDVQTDPRSSDFGKLRFGDTHVDFLSGLSQAVTLLGREITAQTLDSKGKVLSLHHGAQDAPPEEKVKYGGADTTDVIGRFLRTKLSPFFGAILDARSGQNVVGQPVTAGEAAARLFVPLSYGDVVAGMKDQGIPTGTALALAAVLGAGVQNYEDKKPKPTKGRQRARSSSQAKP